MSSPSSCQAQAVPDPIPTLLLAMQRIWHSRPERSLDHLLHLIDSTSYNFLDALATLCTFAPLCDAAAAMVGSEEGCGRLYISVRPAASPELQALVQELWPHVQSIARPGIPSTLLDVSKAGFKPGMLESVPMKSLATTPDHQIIKTVFRACYAKFCASVTAEGGCRDLLAALESTRWQQAQVQPKLRDGLEALPAKLDYLLKAASKDVGQFSDIHLLCLYYTADDVLRSTRRMKAVLPHILSSAMKKLEVLPRAIRHILTGARKEHALLHPLADVPSSNIQWITPPVTPQPFRATTDEDYIRDQFGTVANELAIYPPPETLVPVEDSSRAPRWFTGSAVVHPEAALLGYACSHKVDMSMSGYVGASSPTCYPCFMLLYALVLNAHRGAGPGRRLRYEVSVSQCSFRIPLPWCLPPGLYADSDALRKFRDVLTEDYVTTVRQENAKLQVCYNIFWIPEKLKDSEL